MTLRQEPSSQPGGGGGGKGEETAGNPPAPPQPPDLHQPRLSTLSQLRARSFWAHGELKVQAPALAREVRTESTGWRGCCGVGGQGQGPTPTVGLEVSLVAPSCVCHRAGHP